MNKIFTTWQTTLRIWDCLFYEGSKIIFRVALTLIKRNKCNLLACQDFTTLAECFKEITKDSIVLKCHDFMQVNMFFYFLLYIIHINCFLINVIYAIFYFFFTRVYLKYLDHCLVAQL